MIMEVRTTKLKLISRERINNRRKYDKMCKKIIKWVSKYNKKSIKKGKNNEFLIRTKEHSCLVKSGRYGFIIGLKEVA